MSVHHRQDNRASPLGFLPQKTSAAAAVASSNRVQHYDAWEMDKDRRIGVAGQQARLLPPCMQYLYFVLAQNVVRVYRERCSRETAVPYLPTPSTATRVAVVMYGYTFISLRCPLLLYNRFQTQILTICLLILNTYELQVYSSSFSCTDLSCKLVVYARIHVLMHKSIHKNLLKLRFQAFLGTLNK